MKAKLPHQPIPVAESDNVHFKCFRCAKCCTHNHEKVMLESMDVYRIARYLKETVPYEFQGLPDFIDRYTDSILLDPCGYMLLTLKTTGINETCIFLNGNSCAIQDAKPRACRMYPFTMEPLLNGEFRFYLCQDYVVHYRCSNKINVGNWFDANISQEDREFVDYDFGIASDLIRLMRKASEKNHAGVIFLFLLYKYSDYDLDKPFMPQYKENMRTLMELLKAEIAEEST